MNDLAGRTGETADARKDRRGAVKRVSLWVLIASICVSAVLAIFLILLGRFGELEVRILLTTLTVAGASLCGLSCGALLESRPAHPLPYAGILLGFVAAGLILVGIWTELDAELYWQCSATAGILAVACAHLSLLSLSRLAPRFRAALPAAWIVVFLTADLLVAMIFLQDESPEFMVRLLGACSVLTAAVSVLIPVLHRLSRDEMAAGTAEQIDREIAELRGRIAELEERKARLG